MVKLYILSFLAGLVAAYGVPHFVKGVTGEKFPTPFGRQSSAIVNAAWGWFSLAAAILLLHFSHPWKHLYRASTLFAIAALLMAVLLAQVWSTQAARSKR